jgi:hypothetical protein
MITLIGLPSSEREFKISNNSERDLTDDEKR